MRPVEYFGSFKEKGNFNLGPLTVMGNEVTWSHAWPQNNFVSAWEHMKIFLL